MHDDGYPGMSRESYRTWLMLLDAQCGIVDRRQALRLGFTASHIEHRLTAGRWRRVYEGVYLTFNGPVSREARLWAAVRRAGEGAMLSHQTAAEVQGLADKPVNADVHITVPSRRRPGQRETIRGIIIHRSDRSLPQFPGGPWKLPRTRVEDTVLDLVESAATFEQGYSWIARAVSRDLVTIAMLRAALTGRRRFRWRTWLADALEDSRDGVNSSLERRYVRDVERAHGLPEAQRQARRTLGGRTHYKDNWYAGYRVVVEIDGPAYHQGDRAAADRDRDNLNLAADAAQTLRFGPVNVTERACESAALVAATLRRNGWTGSPHPCRRVDCVVGRTLRASDQPDMSRAKGIPPRPQGRSAPAW
jgi:hypothetical protein